MKPDAVLIVLDDEQQIRSLLSLAFKPHLRVETTTTERQATSVLERELQAGTEQIVMLVDSSNLEFDGFVWSTAKTYAAGSEATCWFSRGRSKVHLGRLSGASVGLSREEAGNIGFIAKPFDLGTLIGLVRATVGGKSSELPSVPKTMTLHEQQRKIRAAFYKPGRTFLAQHPGE